MKPIHTIKLDSLEACIWKNAIQYGEIPIVYYNTTIQRIYRDKDKFKRTNSFRVDELPFVRILATQCLEYITKLEGNDGGSGD